MKKKILAIAVGAAVVLPGIALADGPTVYGKMNIDIKQVSVDPKPTAPVEDSQWELESNASRLGVKGEFDLDIANLKAIYQAEYEIAVDDGAGPFKQRNTFAGLKGGFGTLTAGYFDTPTKKAQGKVDQFNDLDGDIKNLLAGEIRSKNIVQYSTPKFADMITVNAAFIPAENNDIDGTGTPLTNENGLADTVSASVVLETGGFYAALAMDQDMVDGLEVDDLGASGTADITRLVAGFKTDAFELGALYQLAEETEKDAVSNKTGEDTSLVLSGAMKIDRFKLKLQHGVTEGNVSKDEKTGTSFGVDYKLAKASKVFSYYTAYDTDYDAAGVKNDEEKVFGVGMEHKF